MNNQPEQQKLLQPSQVTENDANAHKDTGQNILSKGPSQPVVECVNSGEYVPHNIAGSR